MGLNTRKVLTKEEEEAKVNLPAVWRKISISY